MSLRVRLDRLERERGVVGPCPVCHGKGVGGLQIVIEPDKPKPPKRCSGCGREGRDVVIVLSEDTRHHDQSVGKASS